MAPLNIHINDVKPALTTTIRIRGMRWYAFRLKLAHSPGVLGRGFGSGAD